MTNFENFGNELDAMFNTSEPMYSGRMNPEIKKKWVTALRSGEYKQAKNALYVKDEGMCCLGVLCDIAQKEGAASEWQEIVADINFNEYVFGKTVYTLDGAGSLLPISVEKWSGLVVNNLPIKSRPVGCYPASYGYSTDLTVLNDSGEFTFDQIADLVEYFL